MSVKNAILMSLYECGIIREGEDNMDWFSPDRQFKFIIEREPTIFLNSDYQYIISIHIQNILGVELYKISFNEIEAVRILDQLNWFLYETEQQLYSSTTIQLESNIQYNTIDYIELLWDDIDEQNPFYYKSYEYLRNIKFTISSHNNQFGTIVPICTIYLSDEELNDFMFKLYFISLIDVELQQSYENELENVLSNLVSNGYNIY